MSRRLLLLIGATAALWLVLALPARHLGSGDDALALSGTAALLCLVPGVATFAWTEAAGRHSPHRQVLVALAGSGIRTAVALGGGLALTLGVPYFRDRPAFWGWLVVFYLGTLALDLLLLLTGRPAGGPRP